MSDIWPALAAPFPPDVVSWRIGSTTADKAKGMALAYIDARDVAERLDAVVGPANWQNRYSHADAKTICEIGLRVDGEWIWKADGAGDTDTEAEKGALSDAFKRAAVRFGIGRYLYDVKNSWVEIEPMGRSYKIKAGEYVKLRGMLPSVSDPEKKAPHDANPLVRDAYAKIDNGLNQISRSSVATIEDLKLYWTNNAETIAKLPAGFKKELEAKKDEIKTSLQARAA